MARASCTMFALALVILCSVEAHTTVDHSAPLEPKLKDVKSDKKFFGPPFPADYPEDSRPVVKKDILNKLKGPEQPYPKLQSRADYDADYVKDENSDTGAWQAQFEYDALRKKLASEEADEKGAQSKADKEAADAAAAQKAADAAGKKAGDAKKDVENAAADQANTDKNADDFGGPPSAEKLEKLKKAVEEAEKKLAKETKDFEECEKQLAKAKANLEELKKQQADMEAKLAADTKLWAEQKTTKLNVQKSKQDAATQAQLSKQMAAADKLAAAEKAKAIVDKSLAKEKAEHESAQKNLHKQQAEMKKAKSDLEAAASKLQKLRGYKPADAPGLKSGAIMAPAMLSFLVLLAAQ